MAIQGLRDTSNFVTNQRPTNWREGMLLLEPNGTAPLTALTSLMKKRKVDDPRFAWWEKEMQTRRIALTASLNATDSTTTIAASGGGCKGFKTGDLLLVENSGEIVQVAQDPTSDTALVVTRGAAGSTKAAVTYNGAGVNPNLVCIGSAFEQGSLAPTGVNFDPTEYYNYTQIFRSTLEITRTASKTRLRTGDAVKEAKRECLETFSNDMERAFWFGKRSSGTKNGKPVYTTGGIESYIDASNIKTATAAGCDLDELETYLKGMFAYGSSEKMGFTGNTGLLTLQQIVRKNTTWNIQSGIKEFGMNVTKLFCPFGTLVIKAHPLFNQMTGGTTGSAAYAGRDSYLYVLDMKELQYVTFQDDDVKYQPDLQSNGLDGLQSGYLAECGLEVHFGKAHYLVKGLLSGAKDS